MTKFASVLALLISGASAFVSQNGASKAATALRATEGIWDPMVGSCENVYTVLPLQKLAMRKIHFNKHTTIRL